MANGVRAKFRIEPPFGAYARQRRGARPEQFFDEDVIAEHQGLHEPDTRATADELVAHVFALGIARQHHRRPVIVLVVRAVYVGSGAEQQIEHVAALGLDRDVQWLGTTAPERMRADGVDHGRRSRENPADLVESSSANQLEKPLDHLIAVSALDRPTARWPPGLAPAPQHAP